MATFNANEITSPIFLCLAVAFSCTINDSSYNRYLLWPRRQDHPLYPWPQTSWNRVIDSVYSGDIVSTFQWNLILIARGDDSLLPRFSPILTKSAINNKRSWLVRCSPKNLIWKSTTSNCFSERNVSAYLLDKQKLEDNKKVVYSTNFSAVCG